MAACAATPTRPIQPRPAAPPLDATFFAGRDTTRPNMRVHLIDVGQGAATLVEFSCAAILIDTGGESNHYMDSTENLHTYLRAFFDSRPDLNDTLALVVLTHPHIDHTRGANMVFGEFHVEHLLTDGHTGSSGGKGQVAALHAAHRQHIPDEVINVKNIPPGGLTDPIIDPITCSDGDPDIRVLWGASDSVPDGWDYKDMENENNHSVVVRVGLGQASLLVIGDLEMDEPLVAKHAHTSALDSDIYQVGHHGSYNASSKKLLAAITPKIALIGTGAYDRRTTWSAWAYGHPRAVTIDRVEAALHGGPPRSPALVVPVASGAKQFEGRDLSAPIYATGWDSSVLVTEFATGEIQVKTLRAVLP